MGSGLIELQAAAPRERVGGKAANLARLMAAGYNVPEARAVPVQAFLEHVAACRETGVKDDAALGQAIVARPLEASLEVALERFVDSAGGRVSVRSSANLEDAHTHAFAGQFLTVLNVGRDTVAEAVRRVWASAFTDNVRAYLNRGGLDPAALAMAVVVQRQLDSTVSGVVLGDADRSMVEAVFGQGEAVVSAEVASDHWDLQHGRIVARQVAAKGWQVTVPDGPPTGELTRVELPADRRERASLDDAQVLQVAELIGRLGRDFGGRPQDCEFSFAGDELFVLQTRDVTASLPIEPPPLGPWEPPGKGGWDLDDAHFTRPASALFTELFPEAMERGFRESARRYGALLSHLDFGTVNRFFYSRVRPVAAPEDAASKKAPPWIVFKLMTVLVPELRRRIRTAERLWHDRPWRAQLEEWERDKRAAIAKHLDLQRADLTALDDAALARHLLTAVEHASAMVTQHHTYNFAAMVPTGDLLAHAHKFSDGRLAAADVLGLLTGASDASADLRSPDARRLATAVAGSDEARRLLGLDDGSEATSDVEAAQRLEALRNLDGDAGASAREFLERREFRIVEGLDPAAPCLREAPRMLWRAARDVCRAAHAAAGGIDPALLANVRKAIPTEHHATFDRLLEEARATYFLRDERALYSDIWAWGILRSVYLEIGTRLLRRTPSRIVEAPDILQARVEEAESLLLRGEGPSAEELRRRAAFQQAYTVGDAPARLGPPPQPPPPPDWLPPGAARLAAAFGAVFGAMLPPREAPPEAGATELPGRPASGGVYEGPAHVIASPRDVEGVSPDAVLVVGAGSSAFTMLAPLAAGVVAEGGGLLSHVAIVCREYRIPCVVGCSGVLGRVRNGDRLRVDGTRGTVTLLGAS